MREEPPRQLVELLERLGLATAEQVRRLRGHVRRLGPDLPRFESVWVDALLRARFLTPFQAAELSAGRGDRLRVGPYTLFERLGWPHYAASYRARHVEAGRWVRLVVAGCPEEQAGVVRRRLEALVEAGRPLDNCSEVSPIDDAGRDGERFWAAAPWLDGRSAAEWLMRRGRFPAGAVLEIARRMAVGLRALEAADLCHGDVSPGGLWLDERGSVVLLLPGLRGILRGDEGYHHAELMPEAYDCLAPERSAEGVPPSIAGDLYGFGCVWWHLLCGRSPLGGGNALARLRAAQQARIPDVRRFVHDVPEPLAAAVVSCLQPNPRRRGESAAMLAARLGPPTADGRRLLAAALGEARPKAGPPHGAAWTLRLPRPSPKWLAAAVAGIVVAAAVLWTAGYFRFGDVTGATVGLPDRGPDTAGQAGSGAPSCGTAALGGVERAQPGATVPPAAEPAGSGVQLAGWEERDENRETADLVLDAGTRRIDSLDLKPGRTVRGDPMARPKLLVPREGLAIDADDVRFQNIDFAWDHAPSGGIALERPAIIRLRASRATFEGCTFRTSDPAGDGPAAIRWTHPDSQRPAELSLPSGRVRLIHCVLSSVSAGVESEVSGAMAIELSGVLAQHTGPIVRLRRCPAADETLRLRLAGTTLRETGPLVECRYDAMAVQPGELLIDAVASIFVPSEGRPLLSFAGPEPPKPWLRRIQWTGQDSLVEVEAALAAWDAGDGQPESIDDAALVIAGLVRSRLEFANLPGGSPADSALVRWQGPSRSAAPPGIDPRRLPHAITADR